MAILKSEFYTSSISLTLFCPSTPFKSTSRIIRQLPEKWLSKFDKDPIPFPVPDGAPAEIPKLVLKNQTESWNASFSTDRVSITWNLTQQEEGPICFDVYIGEVEEFIKDIKKTFSTRYERIGIVLHRVRKTQDPARKIASHFCKDNFLNKPFDRPENFEINSHKSFNLKNNTKVNSWFKNRSASITHSGEPIIFVEQDINTMAEDSENNDFAIDSISEFLSLTKAELDTIFSYYYPDN